MGSNVQVVWEQVLPLLGRRAGDVPLTHDRFTVAPDTVMEMSTTTPSG